MALPKKLKNFNVYIEGEGYAGRAKEIELPKLLRNMADYRAAGMNGPVKTDQGMQGMETSVTLAEFSRALILQWGITTVDGLGLRFVGAAVSDTTGATDSIEIVMRGRWEEIDLGSAKTGDDADMKLKAPLAYFKYILNGEVLVEIDFLNMKEIVGGVDRLEEQRGALKL